MALHVALALPRTGAAAGPDRRQPRDRRRGRPRRAGRGRRAARRRGRDDDDRGLRASAGPRPPVLADQPPGQAAVDAAAAAQHPGRPGRGAARAGHRARCRRCGSAWRTGAPGRAVVGERDAKFRAIAEQMAAALAGRACTWWPGAGHAVHLEAPEAVAAVIAARATAPSTSRAGRRPDPGPPGGAIEPRDAGQRIRAVGEQPQRGQPAGPSGLRSPRPRAARRRSRAGPSSVEARYTS